MQDTVKLPAESPISGEGGWDRMRGGEGAGGEGGGTDSLSTPRPATTGQRVFVLSPCL